MPAHTCGGLSVPGAPLMPTCPCGGLKLNKIRQKVKYNECYI